MKTLFLIPARGGSKGIPHKNIRELCGKPLIYYSIEAARHIASDEDICVSTDDREIIECVERTGLRVPFVRPEELASDTAGSSDVIVHALKFYEERGTFYDRVVLLQPTSPLRTSEHIIGAMGLYKESLDMVVSVTESPAAVVLFKENEQGYLEHAFDVSGGVRRQDAQKLYEYNGAVYVINSRAVLEKGLGGLDKVVKYVMPEINSVDIDNMIDWSLCEIILKGRYDCK
ncbi:MAG: acylneuraminate cytidylyltransferase family protein [Ruminococcus sp.]|nr:acylneuraminate cytidylyltransferase family protein [Ruminococcus sp.]